MDLYKELEKNSRKKNKTIIFPESYDERVKDAVVKILKKKIANVILIQTNKKLNAELRPHKSLTIIDYKFSVDFLNEYYAIKLKKKSNYEISKAETELKDPLTFSCMLLKNNFADGIIAGSVYSTTDVLRNAISILGLSKNNKTVSSFFLFTFPKDHIHGNKIIAYADCGVIPVPSPQQLSDIAVQTAANFRRLTGLKPRVAFLSFATKGSADDLSIKKITNAYKITRKKFPKLICDGELQFDAAFVPEVALRKNPGSSIKGNANVFIFPDLNSGNIAYKITERVGGAIATGPIVQGLSKPVMDLSRGCNVNDIVNMTRVVTNL